ncbi:MAG: LLM class F420-dependent oxidoreductase [Chloroflexi bacterium]|nr:LLM class F420-dependent oxidoreductase [Chloroflexota bacterium]
MAVKFGLQIPSFTFPTRPKENVWNVGRELAVEAENHGFDSIWLMDHLFQIPVVAAETDPLLECWTGLAALAAATKRVRLGSMVAAAGFRNPAVLAKMTSTIDVVSNGRLIVGIGAGWCEWEHKAYGIDFPAIGVRMKKLEDSLNILKAMWTQERATYEGQYYQARGAVNSPKPVQKPHPPILIGGSGEKVTLRLCAQYAQAHNLGGGSPEQNAKTLQTLKEHCQKLGTDYNKILKTRLQPIMFAKDEKELQRKMEKYTPPGYPGQDRKKHLEQRTLIGTGEQIAAQLQKYVDIGIDYFIVSFWDADDFENVRKVQKELMPRLKSKV